MPRIGDLPYSELHDRLRRGELFLQTGAFVSRVQSPLEAVADGLALLYANHLYSDSAGFADFHISMRAPAARRWFKPQAMFYFDRVAPFKPLPLDQAFPMFEWGLNWCISNHAHGYLIIHAAVIEKNGFAAMLPAPPSSGKSTLCAALVHRGWRLLSDELALIRVPDAQLIPCPRPVSLKNASIDVIRQFEPNAVLSRTVRDTIKGTVAHMRAPAGSVERSDQAVPAAWIIFPKYQAQAPAHLTAVSRAKAFMRVADNAFNYSLHGRRGFNLLAGLIETCTCYDFTYGSLNDAIETFDQLSAQTRAREPLAPAAGCASHTE